MLKQIWLHSVRAYIRLGLFFYYKRIHVFGLENIPKDQPVLILANHQNALLDALIIAATCNRFSYFLTRASVFNSPFFAKLLRSLRMLPVYRMRDGIQTITKNNTIFKWCSQLLHNNNSIVIFPEGNHNLKRTVRPLSKGFTRLVFDTLETYSNLNLQLVPIGFNYKNPESFADEVAIYIGKPIAANDYVFNKRNHDVLKLKETVHESLSKLTTHIPHEDYEYSLKKLKDLHVDFLNPESVNACLSSNFKNCTNKGLEKPSLIKRFLKAVLIINVLLPYLIWKKAIVPKIKEIEFVSTFRFAVGITLVPIYLLAITVILGLNIGWPYALFYLFAVLILALITVKQ
ncbi:lysophospholipid acyltransferase family protein [Gaetbulibacter sp. M235]|uniref:lysophospholipid acyltransferase family protein n=1 Tax=Gaetbulibacter sp. M235 TaxID=3126510 RepID=UPI00374E793D